MSYYIRRTRHIQEKINKLYAVEVPDGMDQFRLEILNILEDLRAEVESLEQDKQDMVGWSSS